MASEMPFALSWHRSFDPVVGPGRTGEFRSRGGSMWRRASLAFVGVSLTACAAATSYPNPAFVNAGRNVLTAAEIVSARVTDAYQAVIQLRPEFLRHRVAATIPAFAPVVVEVYLDNMPFGTAEAL